MDLRPHFENHRRTQIQHQNVVPPLWGDKLLALLLGTHGVPKTWVTQSPKLKATFSASLRPQAHLLTPLLPPTTTTYYYLLLLLGPRGSGGAPRGPGGPGGRGGPVGPGGSGGGPRGNHVLVLPTTYYLLPTTYYLLPTTYYLLPTTFFLPPNTNYLLLPTHYCYYSHYCY